MEELKKVSLEEKQAFKKHHHQMHRALEKLYTGKITKNSNLSSTLTYKKQF